MHLRISHTHLHIYTRTHTLVADSSNELAELYGPNSKCVNHGTEKWQINGQEVQDSGAGCYEVRS